MYFVYAIYNESQDKIYIGQTIDLKERLGLHNNKIFRNSYTSRFDGEWKVVYSEEYSTRQEVLKREKKLKSYKGRLFIRKIIRP